MRRLLGLAVLLLCAAAQAERLADPTRPPVALRTGAGAARGSGEREALILQSVIISDTSRSAIISGELVTLGGKIGGARLVKVSEAAVVLLTGDSRRTLKLFPGVNKRVVEPGKYQKEEP